MADHFPTTPVQPIPAPPAPQPNQPVYAPGMAMPQQPVYQQSVPVQQPVYVVTPAAPPPVAPPPVPNESTDALSQTELAHGHAVMTLVSHSPLFYWWPVWAVGYLAMLITWTSGQNVQIGDHATRFHPSNNAGVIFFATLFIVILITNITLRGLASALVIMGMALVTVMLAYFGLWDNIFRFFGALHIYLNEGAYFWFSTVVFLVWAFATFVFDRMSYWQVTPGQMTLKHMFGASSKSYDTENMTFEKRRNDVFRHWLLGLGSGDLIINAFNAGSRETIDIPNVLFIGTKVHEIQHLIATKPDDDEAKR